MTPAELPPTAYLVSPATRAAVAGALKQGLDDRLRAEEFFGDALEMIAPGPPVIKVTFPWPAFVLLCADLGVTPFSYGVGPDAIRQTTRETETHERQD